MDTIRNHANVSGELKRLSEKKSNVEQKLANLEKQIYALEGSYLQDTLQIGNILSGWEGYAPQRGAGRRPNRQFRETDRLFSLSSATSLKV